MLCGPASDIAHEFVNDFYMRKVNGLPAAFMLLDGYYDYRFVDKNGNDMAG